MDYVLLDEPMLAVAVEGLALRAWRALGCRDAGRVDLRWTRAAAAVLEVNPLAGPASRRTPTCRSCAPKGMQLPRADRRDRGLGRRSVCPHVELPQSPSAEFA